jgi:mannonate dehydratase
MKITNAYVNITSPGRNFVTLKIETDEGIYGLGDATLNGREWPWLAISPSTSSPASSAAIPFKPKTSGNISIAARTGGAAPSPCRPSPRSTWRSGTSRARPSTRLFTTCSAEKAAKVSSSTDTPTEKTPKAHSKTSRVTSTQASAPYACKAASRACRQPTASAKGPGRYEPAERGLPSEYEWSSGTLPSPHADSFANATREAFGEELHLLHDCHHRLTPIEAARLGKELEPFHLFWMEDPTPAELQEGFEVIREHTTTPIAVGEVFNSIWDAHDLIRNQWIDYLRMTIVHGGGFTALKKTADFAALYHVRTGFHGATDLSPVTMAAALHFDTAIHNFGIQELMPHTEETDAVFPSSV